MRYSRALKVIILKKVMPPESRSVTEVSRETGINYQTIKNWIKQHKMTGHPVVTNQNEKFFY